MSMTPKNESDKPDELREIYHDAVAQDPGPSAQSSAAILRHASQRAAALQKFVPQESKPAANERLWLRHALGGLAAVGLVGWLMLQHAAWWGGGEQGLGAEPGVRPVASAESAAPASATSSSVLMNREGTEVDKTASVAAAPAASIAARQSSVAQKSKENRPQVQADQAPEAMNMKAAELEPASAPTAAFMPAPARESTARVTAPASGVEAAELADTVPQQSPEVDAKLPLCPLSDGVRDSNAGATANAENDAKTGAKAAKLPESKSPNCRPRQRVEKRPAKTEPGRDAPDAVAAPAP